MQNAVKYTRHQNIHRASAQVLDKALELEIVDYSFSDRFQLKPIRSKICKGGLESRSQDPCIWMSNHDRYHDPVRYYNGLLAEGGNYKASWMRALQSLKETGIPCAPEYARINEDSQIGKISSADPFVHLLIATAHEMAHAINQYNYWHLKQLRGKPHGIEWQHIYRQLRVNVLADHEGIAPMAVAALETPVQRIIKRPGPNTKKGRVWAIADAHAGYTRAYIIQLCVQEGIHKGTASVTYAEWKKAQSQD